MSLRSFLIIVLFAIQLTGTTLCNAQSTVKEGEQLEFAQGLLSRGMYDMAIQQCQKFIADYPKSGSLQEAYLSLGEAYFLSQDFKNASDTFNQFRQKYPSSEQLPLSLLRLAQMDIQQQKYDDALKELTSIDYAKQLNGAMLQSYNFYIAKAYQGKSDNINALVFYKQAGQVQGTFAYTADALNEIGHIQAINGKYDEARQAYTQALKAAGDDTLKGEVTYRIAELDFLSGKFSDAVYGFEQVLDQYPALGFNQDALSNMLLAYFNLGKYDQLLAEYQKNAAKLKDDENSYPIHFAAVLGYIELGQYDQANALLDRLLAIPDLKPEEKEKAYIKKADILLRQKMYKEALALLQAQAAVKFDGSDEAYFLQAQAYYGLGDYDHAFNYYENVYLNFPSSRFYKAALLGQAHARQKASRYKESKELFLEYYNIQDDPSLKSEALYDAVMTALKAQDTDGIVSSAQQYLKAFPTGAQYSEVLMLLADHYGTHGQPKQAVDLINDYLSKSPTQDKTNTANFLLGFNEALLGNSDLALKAYALVDQQKEGGKFYSDALKNMAIICLTQKNYVQARSYFDQLISQAGPNDLQVDTYVWVCNEFLKALKYDDVLRVAAQAEKRFSGPDLKQVKYFEAEALRGMGKCDEAQKDYDQVDSSLQKDAFTGSAHIGYGLCLASSKKFDEASQQFQKALDENADDYTVTAHARFEMANIDETRGNLEDALKTFLLIATIYDDDHFCSESLLRAAKISEKLKRNADALKMYTEILDKYKNSTAAQFAQGRIGALK